MTSVPELNRFLAELGSRRQRLVELAPPTEPGTAQLVSELHELSEQLLLADEELRVQQQELDEARDALLALSAERDQLLQHSAKALVVTDEHGVVLQATRAAQQLVRQPLVRLTPRPIASWFAVEDRRAVRSMIGRALATGEPQQAQVLIRLLDEDATPVALAVESVPDPTAGRPRLRWELTPQGTGLVAVPSDQDTGTDPLAWAALALGLAAAAEELNGCRTRDELVDQVLGTALRLVPGAEDAGLVLHGRDGAPESVAATSTLARRADKAQLERALGPVTRALTAGGVVRSGRLVVELEGQPRPPDAGGWPGSAVSVPLLAGERRLGVLTVYAHQTDALGGHAEVAVAALTTHVAVALTRLLEATGLQEAVEARQRIGQAVGILVERHQLTPDAAFALLVRWSQHRNLQVRTIARTLVETGQEPAPLSRRP